MLCHPHTEAATGEQVGPFVFAKHAKQIQNTYESEEERKEALDRLLVKIDESIHDDAGSRAEAFVTAYETAESEYNAFEQSKWNIVNSKRSEKEAERAARKLKNARVVFAKLESLLDGYAHKDIALECSWREESGYCRLTCYLSRQLLGPLLNAPSSATQKKITTAVDSTREVLDLLSSNGFIGTDFLSFLKNSTRSLEKVLFRYCRRDKTHITLLDCYQADSEFIGLVRAGKLVDALLRVLPYSDVKEAFVRGVVIQDPKLSKLAKLILTGPWDYVKNAQQLRKQFAQLRTEFRAVKAATQDYLADPLTIDFLAETASPLLNPNQRFTRQNAVDKMYDDSRSLRYLKQRNFSELRNLHKRFFQSPRSYGFVDVN
jgi:hypothetical protein